MKPALVERIWGGNRLRDVLGKPVPAGKVIGESWELSDRPDVQSTVEGGPCDGLTLRQVIEADPRAVLGEALAITNSARFPLLIKYIDAGGALSVQVHPDDAGAKAYGDLGKSECWVIMHADPGATIVRGFKPGTTRADYQAAVREGRVESLLHSFAPRIGDVLSLPAGMVHAIGAGLLVAEVQQNSDLTFRIHDYGRLGPDGKPRKLHLAEALESIRFDDPGDEFEGDQVRDTVFPLAEVEMSAALSQVLLRGKHFDLHRLLLRKGKAFRLSLQRNAATVLMVVAGSGTLNDRPLKTGQTVLLPGCLSEAQLLADSGSDVTVLLSTPNVQ
jgi:mannose-6-phosphate isomerase